ncbi:MAG: hypothetical protein OXH31_03470 [Gammaproteobacteria bacterium]|nr:hypothetical protein [Gammaproteobacteria bacterium]
MKNRNVLILTSLFGGVGVGLLICFLFFPLDRTNSERPPNQTKELPNQTNYKEAGEITSEENDLDKVIELATAIERRQALYQILESKNAQQIADLLVHSLHFEDSLSSYSIQRLLFTELARVDSAAALRRVWETDRVLWGTFLEIVATQWSLIAPDEALETLSSLEEPWKSKAIKTVFQNQGKFSEQELAGISESLDISDHFNQWHFEVELAEVINEPRAAFELTIEADVSDFYKRKTLTFITSQWIERGDSDDVSSMLSLVAEVFAETPYALWNTTVTEIAASNPEAAWEHLFSLPKESQFRINSTRLVFRAWVDKDPTTAIQAITTEEYMGSMKSEVRWLMMDWVRELSGRVLERMDLVPEDFKTVVLNTAVNALDSSLPPDEMIALLAQYRLQGINTLEATDSFVSNWSTDDPSAAVDWVLQNMDQGTGNGRWMLRDALGKLALTDASKAMEVALEQPEERTLEQFVVLTLLNQGNIEEGLSLIPQVRNLPDASFMFSRAGGTLIEFGRIEEALALAERLDESQRPNFYRSLAWPWLRSDLESLLENLPRLENEEMRSMLAAGVLQQQRWYPYLTEEELESVRAFVSEDTN